MLYEIVNEVKMTMEGEFLGTKIDTLELRTNSDDGVNKCVVFA